MWCIFGRYTVRPVENVVLVQCTLQETSQVGTGVRPIDRVVKAKMISFISKSSLIQCVVIPNIGILVGHHHPLNAMLIWSSEERSLVIRAQVRRYFDVILSDMQVFLERRLTEAESTISMTFWYSTVSKNDTGSSLFTTIQMRASLRVEKSSAHLRWMFGEVYSMIIVEGGGKRNKFPWKYLQWYISHEKTWNYINGMWNMMISQKMLYHGFYSILINFHSFITEKFRCFRIGDGFWCIKKPSFFQQWFLEISFLESADEILIHPRRMAGGSLIRFGNRDWFMGARSGDTVTGLIDTRVLSVVG